jgi:hypothetical protein
VDPDEQIKALAALPVPAQVAFAARLGERALAEVRRLRPDVDHAYPALQKGVDLVWRHALKQDVDFHRDAMAVHAATSKLIPTTPDEPVPDQALLFAGKAISAGLAIALVPSKSAKYAVIVGDAMISLVATVYDNSDEVEEKEVRWQDSAIEHLAANRDKPVTRSMFDDLLEYDRGAVSEEYIKFGGPE